MLRAALKYSYLNAKTRTMHARRLKPSDWHILETTKDPPAFLRYLSSTPYAPWVSRLLSARQQDHEQFERFIFAALFDDYRKIIRSIPDNDSLGLVRALAARFEAENLKIVLRALFSGLKKSQVSHLLYPLDQKLSSLPFNSLWKQDSLGDAVKFLAETVYGPMLRHALSQVDAQGRLFPLEMAIDVVCFRQIISAVHGVRSRRDRISVVDVVNSYVDVVNICHVARIRFVYGLSAEEALNYSYPGGSLTIKGLHALARAKDLQALIKLLPLGMRLAAEGTEDIPGLRMALEDWLLRRMRRAFLGYPFHLGVQVAHLIEKEIEVRSLVRLFQAKATQYQMSQAELVPGILLKSGDSLGGEGVVQAG